MAIASGKYDSNVLRLPETSASEPGGRDDLSSLYFLWVDLPVGPENGGVSFRGHAFLNDYSKLHDLDMLGVSGGVHWRPVAWPALSFLQLGYELQRLALERSSFLDLHTARVRIRPGPKDSSRRMEIDYTFKRKSFVQGTFQPFDALQHEGTARAVLGPFEPMVRLAWLEAERRDFSYLGVETACKYALRLPRHMTLNLIPSFRYRGYLAPDTLDPRRVDHRFSGTAGLKRSFGSKLSIELQGSWESQESTRGRFDYRKTTVGLTVLTLL